MTILVVITPSRLSGAERVCGWLCKYWQDRGHRVIIVTKPVPAVEEWYRGLGLDVRVAGISGKLNMCAILRLRSIIRRERADVVHTHLSTASLWGAIAARAERVPVVSHVHALNSKTCFRFSDGIIAVSNAVKRHLAAQGLSEERIEVVWPITPAVREEKPEPAQDVRSLGERVVSCVAHLSLKKGQHVLLDAATAVLDKVPDAKFVIAGSGPEEAKLRAKASELDISDSVHFMGFRKDVLAILAASRVAVLPSVAGEGFPVAIQEAQAVGTPVVASHISGVPELIEDGLNGFLVPPGDAGKLAEKICAVLLDDELHTKMSAESLRRAEDLSFEKAADECLRILQTTKRGRQAGLQ